MRQKRRKNKKIMTYTTFKSKFIEFVQKSMLKKGVTYEEYDRIMSYSNQVNLFGENRNDFEKIMNQIKRAGKVHYVLPKQEPKHCSVHTVPNRIG